jgi:5-formyltetrahydrofolate cyclo-ligase
MPAYRQLHAAGIHLALPVVIDKEAPLRFVAWAPEDELIAGAYGTRVPARHDIVLPDALLIPCVGFNTARFRVGYGGGFYDRTLAQATRPLTLGVAYEATLASFTPDAHDIALDTIITEEKQYRTA